MLVFLTLWLVQEETPQFGAGGETRTLYTVRTEDLTLRSDLLYGGAVRLDVDRFTFSLGYAQAKIRKGRMVSVPQSSEEPFLPILATESEPATYWDDMDGTLHLASFDVNVAVVRSRVGEVRFDAGLATSAEYIALELNSYRAYGFLVSGGPFIRVSISAFFVEGAYSWGYPVQGDIEGAEGIAVIAGACFSY